MDDVYRRGIMAMKNDLPKNWAQTTIGDVYSMNEVLAA